MLQVALLVHGSLLRSIPPLKPVGTRTTTIALVIHLSRSSYARETSAHLSGPIPRLRRLEALALTAQTVAESEKVCHIIGEMVEFVARN